MRIEKVGECLRIVYGYAKGHPAIETFSIPMSKKRVVASLEMGNLRHLARITEHLQQIGVEYDVAEKDESIILNIHF